MKGKGKIFFHNPTLRLSYVNTSSGCAKYELAPRSVYGDIVPRGYVQYDQNIIGTNQATHSKKALPPQCL